MYADFILQDRLIKKTSQDAFQKNDQNGVTEAQLKGWV